MLRKLSKKEYKALWWLAIAFSGLALITIFLPSLRLGLEDGTSVFFFGFQTTFGGYVSYDFDGLAMDITFGFNYVSFILYALIAVSLFGVIYSFSTKSNLIVSMILLRIAAIMMFFMKETILFFTPQLLDKNLCQSTGPWLGAVLLIAASALQLARFIYLRKWLKKKKAERLENVEIGTHS